MHSSVDAYLAYNEQELPLVEPIAEWLTSRGVSTHFFARDKQYGKPVDNTGDMENARVVIAFLGSAGWGPNHKRLVELARKMQKPVYPVLIGDMNPGDDQMADGLFATVTWADARNGDLKPLEALLLAIREHQAPVDPEVEEMIESLIAGPDELRQVMLEKLIEKSRTNRATIASSLRDQLTRHGAGSSSRASSADTDSAAEERSWLRVALIHCDPENPQTREIALRDIEPDAEPAEFGRFWCLAAARRAEVSYLPELAAKAARDKTTSISFAAIALYAPDSDKVLEQFRNALRTGDHWTTRGVLRALRIVSVPEVTGDVCAFAAGWNRAQVPMYDVFCALATPQAARLAAPILAERPGTDTAVDMIIDAARNTRRTTTNNFARLLAILDASRSREILNVRATEPQVRSAALQLLEGLDTIGAPDDASWRHLPGFAADTIDEQDDQLGIQAEVQTLASIMMAREVTPPLAIGLFGEWGSGKSFFMSRMRKTVTALSQRPAAQETSPYCSSVVQITFNAWHYAETNLWASLVSAIFEKLAVHVFGGTPTERQQAALIAELASAKAVTKEALAEEQRATEQLKDEEVRLDELRKERLTEEQKLAKFNPTYLIDLLEGDSTLKRQAEEAFQLLGLPTVLDRVDDFKRAVTDAGSLSRRVVALATVLSRDTRSPLYLCLFVGALVVVPGVAYAIHHYYAPDNRLFTSLGSAIAGFGTVLVATADLVRRGMRKVDALLEPIVAAKKKADAELDRIRAQPAEAERAILANVEVLKAKEQDARRRVAEAAARVAATEERLREIKESRDLARFIADRHDSADYRKHLGLVSLVRQDFEALVERIQQHGTPADGGRKLERIVLYIDDLDRCPASQVVNVLQAVHLLLAYPLFVVVVGVDSRWLTNSLAIHYKELGVAFTGQPEAAASPQHYLEKIFQIPYALRPMSQDGYGKLMEKLMAGGARVTRPVPAQPATSAPAATAASTSEPPPGESTGAGPSGSEPAAPTTHPAPVTGTMATQPALVSAPAPVEERALVIHAWEEAFAKALYRMIPSPRAAKRLSNVYRVLKAGVGGSQLQAFEGNRELPGQFQVPLLLLAMQICEPVETAAWFRQLLDTGVAHNGTAQAFEGTKKVGDNSARARLWERIEPIVSQRGFPREPALLARWIPLVSRFTFDTRPAD